MGVKVEWPLLFKADPRILTVLPTDTIWPDPRFPRMDIILSDQTASVQSMNFTGCGNVYTSGFEFRRRLLLKFCRENLSYHAHTLVLLWDKPWTTPRRAEMYALKRYAVPEVDVPVPVGKVRACDGRFYHPGSAPIPRFNPETGLGMKRSDVITETSMEPLPQLLASSWTKLVLAEFICKSLWEFAQSRPEHFIFDTPMVEGDELCDGTVKCNKGSECVECYGPEKIKINEIARHGEADVLFLFHIRRLYANQALKDGGSFLVRGTNDRDLLAVLAIPDLADRIIWCKGTNNYAMSPSGEWEKPGALTGDPIPCHEYISMARVVKLFSSDGLVNMLFTRLMLLFFYGGDYCECPKGITATALNATVFSPLEPIVLVVNATTLALDITALHYFIQNAVGRSVRCKSRLEASNLLKCTLDAFFSLCYYTGFHCDFSHVGVGVPVGPNVLEFGYTGPGWKYEEKPDLLALFKPLVEPVLAREGGETPFLVYDYAME